jgi:hypothetical protein
MDFVSSAFATWLLEQLADVARGRLVTFLLGDEQERALRSAAATAIQLTASDFFSGDDAQAAQLALIIDQIFTDPVPGNLMEPRDTLLEVLQSGIAAELAPLGDSDLTDTGLSSLELVGVKLEPLAGTLAAHIVQQIAIRGTRGGPLMPLAVQLGQDATHLQGRRIERKLEQLIRATGCELPRFPLNAGGTARPGQVVVGDIPLEPPGFIARAAVGALADAASRGQPVVVHALTGLRGVGKTQVAAGYARLCVNVGWELIGWINAETREGTLTGLARIAGQLGVADPEGDSLESARRLKDHLNARATIGLLVFDNATDPDGLRSFLPATGATQVVVTSTNRDFTEFGVAVDIASFSREESLFYLNERTGLARSSGITVKRKIAGQKAWPWVFWCSRSTRKNPQPRLKISNVPRAHQGGLSREAEGFARAPLAPLRSCSCLELLDYVGRNAAAVLNLDALPLGPLADLGGVYPRAAAPTAVGVSGRATNPPGVRQVAFQRLASSSLWVALRSISYSVPSRPKRTVPAASPPSRSSVSSV